MIGNLIHHYRILQLVGRGAMGVVYKALDVNLDRTVAIKVMNAEARDDPDFVERFRQEARLQAALNHPNVALLFDYFIEDGAPVAVMEFIDGPSLQQLIEQRGPVPAHKALPLFQQALRGVAAAHRAGIVHRDLKPSNLMITRDDVVKVMDFGIAKREGASGATKASTSIGSPLYMAPEQILGRPVDCRTDVYALGITLYQLLAGQPPFNPRGKAEYVLLNAHVNDLPEPPTVYCPAIPQAVVDVVMRALAKDPDARFQSAEEFMGALPDVPAPGSAATAAARPQTAAPGLIAAEAVPSCTGAIETIRLEYAPPRAEAPRTTGAAASPSLTFDYSAATLRQALHGRSSAPSSRGSASPAVTDNVEPVRIANAARANARSGPTSSAVQAPERASTGLTEGVRARHRVIIAVLAAALVLGALGRRAERLNAVHRNAWHALSGRGIEHAADSSAMQSPPATDPEAPPSHVISTTSASVRSDLTGSWSGEYIDAAGKPLLRVVSLDISRVHDDGGIEGTLRYEAPTGNGECQLHPRGSAYSAPEERLQLSPVGCSPHYPKELGVPLDFGRVNPQTNTLEDGRIEAPTAEAIRVELKRAPGV